MGEAKIGGLDDLLKLLGRMTLVTRSEIIDNALLAAAAVIREEAILRSPRRTGRLARSETVEIVAELGETVTGRAAVKIGPRRGLFYASFIEFGTTKLKANPFLRPAFDMKISEAGDSFRAKITEAFEQVVK